MSKKFVVIAFVLVLGLGVTAGNAFAHHVTAEIPVATSPMKMSLSGNHLFVSSLGEREISVIDIREDRVIRTITTSAGVVAVEAVPEDNKVYAATFESGGIDVYRLDTGEYIRTIGLPNAVITTWYSPAAHTQAYLTHMTGGVALDYNPNNGILYVANYNANYIATIDVKTDQVVEEIPVARHPFALKVDPMTGKVLVASMAGNQVTFLSPHEARGKVTHTITNTIMTGIAPWGIAIDDVKHLAYVSHRGAQHVTVLDIVGEKIVDRIPVGGATQAIAVDTNEYQIYVSYLQQNKIVKIDGKTNEIATTIETGALAWDLAVDSASHKVYASIKGEDKVFVMGPRSMAAIVPVVTMQTPITYVGGVMVHGQDVYVSEITVDVESRSLVLRTDAMDGGRLAVSIPRIILDSKSDGATDTPFIVHANGNVVPHESMASDENFRVISMQVPKNTEALAITGTAVIPEFGPIAALILVASITAILVAAKSRTPIFK